MFEKIKKLFAAQRGSANTKGKVLVVEDSEVDQKFLSATLTKNGYQVRIAENGEVGLQKAKEDKPDLILLDCEMPVMGGVEMCKRLKDDNDLHEVPVIFLTAVNTPRNIIDCFELDAENYLSKPISSKLLMSFVESVLKKSEG